MIDKVRDFLVQPISDGSSIQIWVLICAIIAVISIIVIIILATKPKRAKKSVEKIEAPAVATGQSSEKPNNEEAKEVIEAKADTQYVDKTSEVEELAIEETSSIENSEVAPIEEIIEDDQNDEDEQPVVKEEEVIDFSTLDDEQPEEEAVIVEDKASEETAAEEVAAAEVESETVEEVVVEKPKAKKAPAKKATATKTTETKTATKKKPVDKGRHIDVDHTEELTEFASEINKIQVKAGNGKYEISNSDLGGFIFCLYANNGQILYESRNYASYDSCEDAITRFKNACADGTFSIKEDMFKKYRLIIKPATASAQQYYGDSFETLARCKQNAESIKRFSQSVTINDATDADFVAELKTHIISDEVRAKTLKSKVTGKIKLYKLDAKCFEFVIYANNGTILFESREYKTLATCKQAVTNFKNGLQKGEFIIDREKTGNFKYIIRGANHSLDYIGPIYASEANCRSGADSLFRFAYNSEITED